MLDAVHARLHELMTIQLRVQHIVCLCQTIAIGAKSVFVRISERGLHDAVDQSVLRTLTMGLQTETVADLSGCVHLQALNLTLRKVRGLVFMLLITLRLAPCSVLLVSQRIAMQNRAHQYKLVDTQDQHQLVWAVIIHRQCLDICSRHRHV